MNYVANWTANTFGPAAANAVFASGIAANGPSTEAFAATNPTTGAVTTAPNATLASSFAAVLSVVMIAYMVYQIANILVKIIWECEPKEFELGAKKETKVCHYVGSYCASKTPFGCIEKRESYCCFNSPLGRIIQEQGRPQLGMTWGDAENPSCEALGVDQIAKLDWSKIDISEWIGLLQVTNFYPTADKINLDNLTGKGSALNIGEGRTDTLNRNTERLDGLNESFSETRKAAEDNLRDTFNK
jgi:conjugal transfer mating pair stabilization protein TraN